MLTEKMLYDSLNDALIFVCGYLFCMFKTKYEQNIKQKKVKTKWHKKTKN